MKKIWPYWLKGAIVFLTILVIIMAADFVMTCDLGNNTEFCGIFTMFASFPVMLITLGQYSFVPIDGLRIPVFIALATLLYFIIGSMVGWVIGKIVEAIRRHSNAPRILD